MFQNLIGLTEGHFADVVDDWRILVVETDLHHAGVFYLGNYPYDADGRPLHPDAPVILNVWNRTDAGARQISERQKRFAHFTVATLVEPIFEKQHA